MTSSSASPLAKTKLAFGVPSDLDSEEMAAAWRERDAPDFKGQDIDAVPSSASRKRLRRKAAAPGTDKLGQRIARQMETDIISGEWRVGDQIGREEELAAKYKVSRSVMREAVSLVEMDGLIESRRGRNGGIFVKTPGEGGATATLRNYLVLTGATFSDLIDGRMMLESAAVRKLAQIGDDRAQSLRELTRPLKDESPENLFQGLNRLLFQILRSLDQPVLTVLSDAVSFAFMDRTQLILPFNEMIYQMSRDVWDLRCQQAFAIMDRDADAALDLQNQLGQTWRRLLDGPQSPPAEEKSLLEFRERVAWSIAHYTKPLKKPEALARNLAYRIEVENLVPGDKLGSEPQLIAELGVGRGVFREAVRNLERFGIVEMERGKHGGLRVAEPFIDSARHAICLYFSESYRKAPDKVHALGLELEIAALDKAVARVKADPEMLEWAVAMREERTGPDKRSVRQAVFSPYVVISRLSGDRVLSAVMGIITHLIDFETQDSSWAADRVLFRQAELELFDAIIAGDGKLARRSIIKLRGLGYLCGPRTRDSMDLLRDSH